MAKIKKNGDRKTLQSSVSKEEYKKLEAYLKKISEEQNIIITESAYIRKLILDDMKKGDSS
ncbi:MAG: hypothetical protein PHS33_09340 [Candidatus Omnitrophica bacterium]|nr:hypothetical protein [Candidatus Omnitrophota bacterium]